VEGKTIVLLKVMRLPVCFSKVQQVNKVAPLLLYDTKQHFEALV
jgi:hypothetical protein